MSLDRAQREQARAIASELQQIARSGRALSGTISERRTYCGRAGCACQADPPRPHGPYWQWTRKVSGKTLTRRLTAKEAARYRPWLENMRRLRELLGELEALSLQQLASLQGADRAGAPVRSARAES